jgi:hypothetical protein
MARKNPMKVETRRRYQVIDLGPIEIWDGADLALLRETLTRLISVEGFVRIGVDMSHVKYVPSGFFGMIFDWCEQGATICLDNPCERVKNMIWFRQFLVHTGDERFRLEREALQPATVGADGDAGWMPQFETPELVGSACDGDDSRGV